jgi:hypothetical protein
MRRGLQWAHWAYSECRFWMDFLQLLTGSAACSMWVVKEVRERSGFIASRTWLLSFSAWHWANMTKFCSKRVIKYVGSKDLSWIYWHHLEPNDGESGAVRFSGQLKVVHANEYNSVLKQGGSFPAKAGTVTFEQLFPGLLGRKWYQQSLKISALEIQPSQPSTPQPIPSVRFFLLHI